MSKATQTAFKALKLIFRVILLLLKGIWYVTKFVARITWKLIKDRRRPDEYEEEAGEETAEALPVEEDREPMLTGAGANGGYGTSRPIGVGTGGPEQGLPSAEASEDVMAAAAAMGGRGGEHETAPKEAPIVVDLPDEEDAEGSALPEAAPTADEEPHPDDIEVAEELTAAPVHTREDVESEEEINLGELPMASELGNDVGLPPEEDEEEEQQQKPQAQPTPAKTAPPVDDEIFGDPILTASGSTPPVPMEASAAFVEEPVDDESVMDIDSFMKALEDSGVIDFVEPPSDTGMPEAQTGLQVNYYVVVETDTPEGPVVFRSRILSADKNEIMLCREKDDCKRAPLDVGTMVCLTYRGDDGQTHQIRAPISGSSGPWSPWFSAKVDRSPAIAGVPSGPKEEEPEFFFRALPKAPMPGTSITSVPMREGKIIRLDLRGMVLRTADHFTRGTYVVQDVNCTGFVHDFELQGTITRCKTLDKPEANYLYICNVQFSFLSAKTRKQLGEMGTKVFSAISETTQ